jgi:hypothetical protein
MSDWFGKLSAGNELTARAASELEERGFVVFPGMVPVDRMKRLAAAYTAAVTAATGDDVKVGSTSTKVSDFVNRDAEFDDLYVFPPLLEACCRVIGGPFKLSSFAARTVRAGSKAQELHVDVPPDSTDWPLLGFILMVDDFGRTMERHVSPRAHTGGLTRRRTPCRMCAARTKEKCWHAQVPARCLSSTGPRGMAILRTDRTDLAGRSRVRSFPGAAGPPLTSRRAGSPTLAPASDQSRSTCLPSDWPGSSVVELSEE